MDELRGPPCQHPQPHFHSHGCCPRGQRRTVLDPGQWAGWAGWARWAASRHEAGSLRQEGSGWQGQRFPVAACCKPAHHAHLLLLLLLDSRPACVHHQQHANETPLLWHRCLATAALRAAHDELRWRSKPVAARSAVQRQASQRRVVTVVVHRGWNMLLIKCSSRGAAVMHDAHLTLGFSLPPASICALFPFWSLDYYNMDAVHAEVRNVCCTAERAGKPRQRRTW